MTKKCEDEFKIAKQGQTIKAKGMGLCKFQNCVLEKVVYIPDWSHNLLSVCAITNNGGEVIFPQDTVKISKEERVIAKGNKKNNGLYKIFLQKGDEKEICITQTEDVHMGWHRKLAHRFGNLKKVSSLCDGVPSSLAKCEPQSCSVCFQAKQVREPFSSVRERATRPLQIIHTDVCGPIKPFMRVGRPGVVAWNTAKPAFPQF